MQRIAYLLSCLLVLVFAIGCDSNSQASTQAPPTDVPQVDSFFTSTSSPADNDSIMHVGVFFDEPPFESLDSSGDLVGFDIDLMRAIAEEAGFKDRLKFVETRDWTSIFHDVAEGKFDMVISAATITEERQELVNFSDPYFQSGLAIVVRDSPNPSGIAGPMDLDGRKVGVTGGSTSEMWVNEHTQATVDASYSTLEGAFEALVLAQVDAVVHDVPVILTHLPRYSTLRMLEPPVIEEYYGIAVGKDKPELLANINSGLAAVRASGQYDQIYQTWFGREEATE